MSYTWDPNQEDVPVHINFMGWVRVVIRTIVLSLIILTGVILTALTRLIEGPVFGHHRPVTPYITQGVCRLALMVIGIGHITHGQRMNRPGAVVSNHSSWLDIFALNAHKRIYFVSKSEVAKWPGIGLLARITGTAFIARDPRQARAQTDLFETRLLAGHKLLFFPEGTSTDGLRVLPFKTTLFQSFFSEKLCQNMYIQPVTVNYQAPSGQEPQFYGWWGDMVFGPHMLKILSARRQGAVTITYHPPVKVDDFANRKTLAAHLEKTVRGGMPPAYRVT